jgi:hypothetical protein
MAVLTNPINKQNIVNRFADYVVASANSGISWGTNATPPYFSTAYFGGTTGGKPIESWAGNIPENVVTASTIYNVLVAETQRYSGIRNLRALVYVVGGGGNTPAGPQFPGAPGYVYDVTAKAYMNVNYRQATVGPANAGVAAGQVARAGGLESFYNNLRATYFNYAAATVTIQVDVCHASCHSSCHSNRSRR